ncbi:MAG: ABC transporter ATP-binding protein [Planctomycetes bacterium]|nr:ABC transporter ATP-binding protein [Planctomycetota bacterium]
MDETPNNGNPQIIKLDGVSKWYGEVLGLSLVSIEIEPGITALLGPNGAGKSTFLKIITGQIRQNRGSVRVLGEKPWNNAGLLTRVGFCPETDNFYEFMTGFEWLKYLARLSGYTEAGAAERANELLRAVSMQQQSDKPIGKYSKGMRQRIKLAQALISDPELLVLDEPMTGADPLAREEIYGIIRKARDDGKSVLVSSHVLYEVEDLTENIVLINQGRIRAQGSFGDIRRMLSHLPHKVIIVTSEKRRIARDLLEFEHVVSVDFNFHDRLCVFTSNADEFFRDFTALQCREKYRVEKLWTPDDRLESVFHYLVGSSSGA